jgi:hypothetical protein
LDGQATVSGRQGAQGRICGLFSSSSSSSLVFILCNIFVFIRLNLLSLLHKRQFSFFLLSTRRKVAKLQEKAEVNVWWIKGRTPPKPLYIRLTQFCRLVVAAFGILSISLPNKMKD